jgi:hypothetical protein
MIQIVNNAGRLTKHNVGPVKIVMCLITSKMSVLLANQKSLTALYARLTPFLISTNVLFALTSGILIPRKITAQVAMSLLINVFIAQLSKKILQLTSLVISVLKVMK